ncbi:MAG: iron-containing alcohol dehydrogenase [Butyrivibrio sp.]|nr:iron-containing alcohol dehydrogenase [Butyrivibrio sp.]
MRKIVLSGKRIITGEGCLSVLSEFSYKRVMIVTGGKSMIESHVIDRATDYIQKEDTEILVYSGVPKNPSTEDVDRGLLKCQSFKPDCILTIGGGSALDCAKAILLFYEFPYLNFDNVLEYNLKGLIPAERKTALICVPSTSGTGSELTRGTVITDIQKELKVPIMTDCLRPDIAILDVDIVMTMPKNIVAETGMDALTHAIEAYINHNLDEFDEGLCSSAIVGIMEWLPKSVLDNDKEAREKIHNYQAMAGIGFANVGLGMVHGIAHAFGAAYNMAHGLTNAIILPYVLDYNRQDPTVDKKLKELSYRCHCSDIVKEIIKMRKMFDIPESFNAAGITEEMFLEKHDLILEHAMLGATRVNPVVMNKTEMDKMIGLVYWGK